ncbi:O-antigen ligase family protein [Clostridium intestinale]|uniref:O-antigen ligase family protein n=1 Tax=Clostridium intestinale TaxID=36845 RepID=UPI0028E78D1C|nr:O-antigen ligase family protein [Clostridium intestinale]
MSYKVKRNIIDFLGLIIIVEMILGGLGNIFNLPIRKALFGFTLLFCLYFLISERKSISKKYIWNIFFVLSYIAYGTVVGLIYGNSVNQIISTANVFIGIFYLIILSVFLNEDTRKINKVINLVVNLTVILSFITIGIFVYSRFYMPSYWQIINMFSDINDKLNYGLITGALYSHNYARVYFFNGIYMQVALSILLFRIVDSENKNIKVDTIKFLIVIMAILASGTRGYWLGTIVVLGISFIYFLFNLRKTRFKIKPIIISGIIIALVLAIFPKTVSDKSILNIINNEEGIALDEQFGANSGSRMGSITDFTNDPSNSVRKIQFDFLSERIKQHPIVGSGLGATIPEYVKYMEDNNLQAVSPASFELYYIELMFKTGAVGIALILIYLLIKLIQLIKLVNMNLLTREEKNTLVSYTIGFVSCVVSSFTNPYFAGLTGFFIFVFQIYIFEAFRIKYLDQKY